MFNPELMNLARAGAREYAMTAALEKLAVIPGGQPDPAAAAGGAPPGMDPAMGGAPPGMDPAAAAGGAPPGAPPTDPALAAAGGGMQDMVNQAVQAAMAAQGGGGAGGAPGAAGKTAKPDVAVELQKSNQMIYKLGIMLQALCKEAGLEFPPAVMFGPPPDQSDPALAAIATTPPQQLPGGGPGGAQGQPPAGDPAAGGAQPPFPPIQGLSGNVADGGASEKAGSVLDDDNPLVHAAYGLDEILKAANAARAELALDPVDAMDELLTGLRVEKVAMPPQMVGAPFAEVATGPLSTQPMALARRMRERAGAR